MMTYQIAILGCEQDRWHETDVLIRQDIDQWSALEHTLKEVFQEAYFTPSKNALKEMLAIVAREKMATEVALIEHDKLRPKDIE